MNDLVTYEDFPEMGLTLGPPWVRQRMRYGKFPKAVKGGRIDGNKSRYFWVRKDVQDFIDSRKKPKHE